MLRGLSAVWGGRQVPPGSAQRPMPPCNKQRSCQGKAVHPRSSTRRLPQHCTGPHYREGRSRGRVPADTKMQMLPAEPVGMSALTVEWRRNCHREGGFTVRVRKKTNDGRRPFLRWPVFTCPVVAGFARPMTQNAAVDRLMCRSGKRRKSKTASPVMSGGPSL
jgi:hypothetical protein